MLSNIVEIFKNWAKNNDWNIIMTDKQLMLPEEVTKRYKNIPKEWLDFISNFQEIMNSSENMWFLTFNNYIGNVWRYNDFEKISIEAADGDEEWIKSIESFWNNTFPIIMSVGGDYQYYAIEINSGKIFQGCEPEFEEITYVANSFIEFIEKIVSGEIELVI